MIKIKTMKSLATSYANKSNQPGAPPPPTPYSIIFRIQNIIFYVVRLFLYIRLSPFPSLNTFESVNTEHSTAEENTIIVNQKQKTW